MNSFLQLLFRILLLNKGPQDFPHSTLFMQLCIAVYFISGLPSIMMRVGFEKAVLAMLLDIAVLMVFVYFCLQAFSKSERYVQSITALMSVGIFFQIVMFPLLSQIGAETKPGETVLSLILVFAIWMFSVFTYIFKESFSIRLPAAIVLMICYGFISQLLSVFLFPEINSQ